ncbi:Cytosolic non-specific dipeptidase [Blattella germanica]|nr:Cytosolic non-specific dipeptidase [Blattella germanica]
MSLPDPLKAIFSHIDANKKKYIETLREAVAIQSVSAWPEKRGEIVKMAHWVKVRLEKLGTEVEICELGKQKLPDGGEIPLPPAVLGILGKDPNKKTVLIYGHLDVQPALKSDGWDTEPFELVEKDDKLYGRGSSDDKGPVIGWIHALEAYQSTNQDIPINIKVKLLQHRWRFPSLSLHGMEGAFSESGCKTVIPRKVIGKFSIRIVPNQTPEKVEKVVVEFLNKQWSLRGSTNKMKAFMYHGGRAWLSDPEGPNYVAGRKATKHVYGVEPDMTREGGSIPVTLTFQELTGKSVMLLPVGAGDDGAHSQNEKLDVRNYIEGTKLLGAYLYELGQL